MRKLLIDIAGVRNAWIQPHISVKYWLDKAEQRLVDGPLATPGAEENPPLNGLYDVFIEHEDFVKDTRSLRVGPAGGTSGAGGFIKPGGRGLRFHASHELTLVAVSLFPEAAGEVTIRLVGKDGGEQEKTLLLEKPGQKNRVQLGFRIPPGEDYRLEAVDTEIKLFRATDPTFPYSIEHIIHIVSGSNGTQNLPLQYYFFFDWEITYAAPPLMHFSPPRNFGTVGPNDNTGTGAGGYIAAQEKGIEFEATRDLVLTAVHVYAETPGTVEVRLLDAPGNLLKAATGEVTEAKTRTRIDLHFEIAGGKIGRASCRERV